MTTNKTTSASAIVLAGLLATCAAAPAMAAGGHAHIERQPWSFSGFKGQFDKAQLQRGVQIYEKVCSSCHGLNRVNWRNLVEKGGPEFPEDAVKALAAGWPNQITDGPNDAGEMFDRPGKLSDPIVGPYKNEKAARAAQNGAYPPDLSLMAKARNVEYSGSVAGHPLSMVKDILTGYQEGGADYIHALMIGYTDLPGYTRDETGKLHPVELNGHKDGAADKTAAPAKKDKVEQCASVTVSGEGKPDVCNQVGDGMNYNAAYPGGQIAMVQPLGDNSVTYALGPDGKPNAPETLDQHARDVAAFLSWAADPHLNTRKAIGWQVMLYLLVTTVLLYLGKKRIWSRIEH
jgi:ubiquinol-cytochrome c reductase cytochrome c1 subunit